MLEPARPYVHSWHMEVLCAHLEAVTWGQFNRLLINVPPGTMKSLVTSVIWPAWEWAHPQFAHMRYFCGSYAENFVRRDGKRMYRLVSSDLYQKLFPHIVLTSDADLLFENSATGERRGRSVLSFTGGRGDRVIWDDPHSVRTADSEAKRQETTDTFRDSITSRMIDPTESAIIIIMQRLHVDDVSGVILQLGLPYVVLMLPMEYEADRACYTPLDNGTKPFVGRFIRSRQAWLPETWKPDAKTPALVVEQFEKAETQTVFKQDPRTREGELLAPARFTKEVVERDKKAMSSRAIAGQLQQRPAPREGNLFKRIWFDKFVKTAPAGLVWVRHWDLASTEESQGSDPDATCGVLIGMPPEGEGPFYVAHCEHGFYSPLDVRKIIKATSARDFHATEGEYVVGLSQDPGQAGKSQIQSMAGMLAQYVLDVERETGNKFTRAEPFSSQCEAGNVILVTGEWNLAFIDELCEFPGGKHDDRVDAASGAFARLLRYELDFIESGNIGGHS